jgi:hypothetical protein
MGRTGLGLTACRRTAECHGGANSRQVADTVMRTPPCSPSQRCRIVDDARSTSRLSNHLCPCTFDDLADRHAVAGSRHRGPSALLHLPENSCQAIILMSNERRSLGQLDPIRFDTK